MNKPAKQHQTGKTTFFKGEKSGCESIFQQIFGFFPENFTLFSLTATPKNALLTIGIDDNGLLFEIMEPIRLGLTAQMRIFFNESGQKELRIDDYRFLRRRVRNQGIGTELFIRQIQTASELGLSVITLFIHPLPDEIGEIFFSRFGFLPENQKNSRSGKKAKNRYSLIESTGEKWVFDLSQESRSMQIFKQFIRKRKAASIKC